MRIVVLAVGRLKSGPETDLVARYMKRAEAAGRGLGITGLDLVEIPESRAGSSSDRAAAESAALLSKLPAGARLVVLDETGKARASEDLAQYLREAADSGEKDLAFAIGGPDGHGEEIRRRADLLVSFGRATWPHQLVRAMLLEQIYRATTILSGHPYHRA